MYGDILYNRLPSIYRIKDAEAVVPDRLKNYLEILGGGMDEMYTYTQALSSNFDTDDADSSVLSASIKLLGFKFPYDMTDAEKRNLIKILPLLYINKGNAKVFQYLAVNIFGIGSTATAHKQSSFSYILDPDDLISDTLYVIGQDTASSSIIITVKYPSTITDLEVRKTRYEKFVDLFRPVNCQLNFNYIEGV